MVLTTLPDAAAARRLAVTLVEERLAACGNVVPSIESVYRWEGQVATGQETLLVLKTSVERYPALESRIKGLHPYEVPEILRLGVDAGWPGYLAWVSESVQCEPRL